MIGYGKWVYLLYVIPMWFILSEALIKKSADIGGARKANILVSPWQGSPAEQTQSGKVTVAV